MFEKEAEDSFKCKKVLYKWETDKHSYIDGFKDGAEFGYNKAFVEADKNLKAVVADFNKVNEWHFVKDGVLPKEKGNYLVAWKRTHHVEEYGEWGFDVDLFNVDEGYFEGDGDYVIAWKEIVLPEEIKER